MAAAKKRKAKVKRKKAPSRKPAIRRKSAALKKKAPARKQAQRRAAPRKKTARPSRTPRPAASAPAPIRGPMAGEVRVGVVTHYFGHLSVAAVRLESGSLRVGDTVRVLGHTSDFRQRVDSIQVEHQPVSEASAGQEIGLRVTEHAREHDAVYKVTA